MRAGHLAILLATVLIATSPAAMLADGSWLDGATPQSWPTGATVPAAPALPSGATLDLRCLEQTRPPETAEDRQLAAAGWMLIGDYRGGWGTKVVMGASYFDGMCRPLGYQVFVFDDGLLAGTVSPVPMDSRTDGAAVQTLLQGPDRLTVVFTRYTDTDALCCPSRTSSASYQINHPGAQPVLVLTSVSTNPTSSS
jgi:LppP/LprE lipoprotein